MRAPAGAPIVGLSQGEPLKKDVIGKRFLEALVTAGWKMVDAPREDRAIYGSVRPTATYRPWTRDADFLDVWRRVREHTLVDMYRCYELWQLVSQAQSLNAGALVEVGVWRGGTGALIARRARDLGIMDPVFLCDTFTGVVKAGAKDTVYKGGEHADTSVDCVEFLLDEIGVGSNVVILEGVFPDDTADAIGDVPLRFCHIDVDVYESARGVAEWAWHRLCHGGIIVYDDYGFSSCDGVARYVDEQIGLNDRLILHNLNGHAVVIKR